MPWVCPKCGRSFRGKDQWHSCVKISVEDHLAGKPDSIVELYKVLEKHLLSLPGAFMEPVKTEIMFKAESTFSTLKVRKNSIEIEFALDHPEDVFPIRKVDKYSTNRYNHVLSVDSLDDIDPQLLNWLTAARETVKQ